MNNSADQSRIVEIALGDDVILAHAISATLAAEGIETELVLSSDPYPGLQHSSPHRLMIAKTDIDAAGPIIDAHLRDTQLHDAYPHNGVLEHTDGALRRRSHQITAGILLVFFAGGPLFVLFNVLRELLANF